MDASINVFGEALQSCSDKPKTGFFRDGCCNTSDQDVGSHTVCVEVTKEFLEFSPDAVELASTLGPARLVFRSTCSR